MARRLRPTLIDYLVIAINPALIMVLVGSLIYFLLEMFYQGQYPARLHYCLTLFVIGAVLIARISMEEGWERAAPFGIGMALVILAAMHKFVVYRGTNLEEWGWLVNYGLIGIAWWCAHKLTWDCTLMDESSDASGEGLLQTVGLDAKKPADAAADSILPAKAESKAGGRWWQRYLERRRRPHAPGVWVVYFSLAALPMFGLGQAFIPQSKEDSRRYAFLLLAIYVASALGLLLTTSFLGLRRYLRQRRLEMPATMAGVWLTTGLVLIVCLLATTALLPRPNAEYDISKLPFTVTSEEHEASKVAAGREGVEDKNAETASGRRSHPENQDSEKDKDDHKNGQGDDPNSKRQGDQVGQSKSGEPKPADGGSGKSKSGQSSSGKSSSDKSASDQSKPNESSRDAAKSDAPKPADSKPAESKPNESKSQSKPNPDGSRETKSSKPPEASSRPDLSGMWKSVGEIVKLAFYCMLAGVVIWWLLFHWRDLLNGLLGLLSGWGEWWQKLFGRRKSARDAARRAPPPKSFADFSDPFSAGVASRWPPVELVRYSFEALEAWARDNGWPRESDQTVHDFAQQIGIHVESLAAPARTLADLYSWAAYSPRTLPAGSADLMRKFWQALSRADRRTTATRESAAIR
jgi:hypothetical protein